MNAWTLLLTLMLPIELPPAANPCGNGSFETLGKDGFPTDWSPLGKAMVSPEGHSGAWSLRLVRTTEPPNVETGVNARNIDRLKGGIDFHYKAVSARDADLYLYAVPIAASGIEKTGAPRAAFRIPKEHVGDGQWHRGRFRFDFTKNAVVRSTIIAARIQGTAGELLLDDVSYVERLGPVLRIGTVRVEDDLARPRPARILSSAIENVGDAPAREVRVELDAPAGLRA